MSESPKNLQPRSVLDKIDTQIVAALQKNGRITNAQLAESIGIAPSTCIARVRGLIDRGVITGFFAGVDPKALGLDLQVLVSVTLRAGARSNMNDFATQLEQLPEVTQLFFLGGEEDFIIHVMARDADHVRDFVTEYLSSHPAVSTTRTSIVFRHTHTPILAGTSR